MTTPLQIAIGELGVTEFPRNSNKQKYGEWYGMNGVAWCQIFVQWCYAQANMPLPFKTASCSALLNWYKANYPECIVKEPKANDIAIFKFGHTGIVESAKGDCVTCIEGNTSATNASNGGEVMRATRKLSQVGGFIRPLSLLDDVQFVTVSGVNMMFGHAKDCYIFMGDKAKRDIDLDTYANINYFGALKNGSTTPASMLKCEDKPDYNAEAAGCIRKDGKIMHNTPSNDKQFYGKEQTVFAIKNGKASVFETAAVPEDYDYVVAGVPIMRNGEDVKFATFVKNQGWTGGELYATRHIFLGIKDDPTIVYVMEYKTTTDNMISTAEAFKKFKALGFKEVVKGDGGGSVILKYDGKTIASTTGNRRDNAFITFKRHKTPDTRKANPYGWYDGIVKYKIFPQGNEAKSIQWALTELGYNTGGIDGYFWTKSVNAVKAFQKAEGLEADGIVGNLTRNALKKYFK